MTQDERLLYLLKYFMQETDRYRRLKIPEGTEEKKQLLRALFNVREPQEVPAPVLRVQDEYLQEEISHHGITKASELPFIRGRLCLWQGDITTLNCDAIVNAANPALLGCFVPNHHCIDNAIHTYAGVQLRLECSRIMQKQGRPEITGSAKITGGYNLPAAHVIHTVGPIVRGRLTDEDCRLLASCYTSCLQAAAGLKSVAFCCISTGEFGFPHVRAAEIAVETVEDFLHSNDTSIERVIFNVFKDEDREIYEKLLR